MNQLPGRGDLALCGTIRISGEQQGRFGAWVRGLNVGFVILESVRASVNNRRRETTKDSYISANKGIIGGKARSHGFIAVREICVVDCADPSRRTNSGSGIALATALGKK